MATTCDQQRRGAVLGGGRRSRRFVAVLAVVAAVLAACTNGGEEDTTVVVGDADASAAAALQPAARLAQAVERVDAAAAYRFDMSMWMVIQDGSQRLHVQPSEPIARGEQQGDRYHVVMDLGPLFRSMADQLGPAERADLAEMEAMVGSLTMEMAGDPSALYMRSPMLAAFARMGMGGEPVLAPFLELDRRWGRVDVAALDGLVPAELAGQLAGTQTMDPTALRDLLYEAGGDVRELGRTTVDGVTVTGLGATVSMADALAAQGVDPETFASSFGAGAGAGPDDAGFVDALMDLRFPLAVYVDDDGLVRRLQLELSLDDILRAMPELPEPPPPDAQFELGMTMDFSDYGDPGITVTLPDAGTAVDLTAAFQELASLQGQ